MRHPGWLEPAALMLCGLALIGAFYGARRHQPLPVFENVVDTIYAERPRDVLLYSGVIWGTYARYCRLLGTRSTGPVAVAIFECRFPATMHMTTMPNLEAEP